MRHIHIIAAVIVCYVFSSFAVVYSNEIVPMSVPTGPIILNWNDNTKLDLAGYKVYRSTSETGPFTVIAGNVPVSYYEDGDVVSGMVYFYQVTAFDISDNESPNSNLAYASMRMKGDMDGSNTVNLVDLALFAQNWLDTECWYCNGADFTGDGQVDIDDLETMGPNWLGSTP